ncbi:MAG: hypothetical protein ACI9R8_002201, partial [Candidatus Paceibacteria bacterium]
CAQTLVRMLFMGGVAVVAWLVSRLVKQIHNPIRVYAAIGALIGA